MADCSTTGEVFIVLAKAIFADIKMRLQAGEVRLPRKGRNHLNERIEPDEPIFPIAASADSRTRHEQIAQKPTRTSTLNPPYTSDQPMPFTESEFIIRYEAIALYDFTPEHHNEMPVTYGQSILTSDHCSDGWIVALDQKTGRSGYVPESYVQRVSSDTLQMESKKQSSLAVLQCWDHGCNGRRFPSLQDLYQHKEEVGRVHTKLSSRTVGNLSGPASQGWYGV